MKSYDLRVDSLFAHHLTSIIVFTLSLCRMFSIQKEDRRKREFKGCALAVFKIRQVDRN